MSEKESVFPFDPDRPEGDVTSPTNAVPPVSVPIDDDTGAGIVSDEPVKQGLLTVDGPPESEGSDD